jgi:UDP-glucuronate 4-epimerase
LSHALVTGGAGFIGSHLVDRLLEEGWRVTVADNFDPAYPRPLKERNIAGHRAQGWYRLAEVDIRDRRALESHMDGDYDVVVHLAARSGTRSSILDPVGTQDVNTCGTQNLLECARDWGVKQFVFASAGSVYGVNPRLPWREDDTTLLPVSPFAVSKLSGELLGHAYSHLYGIRFIALRLFNVYGPRQRPDLGIHAMAKAMLAARPVGLHGGGPTRRDYTYVGDAVDGIRAAMEYGDLSYEVINLAGGRPIGLCETLRALEHALGVTALLEPKALRTGSLCDTWANITKAQRLLGYRPRTSLEEGLACFARWLTESSLGDLLALGQAVSSTRHSPARISSVT